MSGRIPERPGRTAEEDGRIAELLARMTTEEKVELVTGLDMWHTRPVERLGIPSIKVTDGPNGARGDGLMGTGTRTACVPSGSALGATWDIELLEEVGGLLGDEARAKGAHVLLAPTINLHRSPKGGRNFECYSEDPILSGELAAAFVRGVQSRRVATTPKHFVGNDSEFERNTIDSRIDERTLREVSLVPFEFAVKKGGAWGVMSAYNRLNGTFCSENEWLLRDVLRRDWGFDGVVVSDWFAARSTAASANSGLSLEMPGQGRFYGGRLNEAMAAGEVSPDVLDGLATEMLRLCLRTGAVDRVSDEEHPLDRPEDRALVRRAAIAGTVLLRNDGILPLDPGSLASVALIGPNAYQAKIMGGGSAKVAAYRAVSPKDALERRLGDAVEVRYARGCDIHRSTPPLTGPLMQGKADVEFFGTEDCTGPVLARASRSELSFMAFGSPADGVPSKGWSLRATCRVKAAVSGPHAFRMVQCGRGRVLVDGSEVIDAREGDFGSGDAFFGFSSADIVASIDLEAGREVEVQLEFSSRGAVILAGVTLGLSSSVEEDLLGEAERVAAGADVAVVVVGTNDDWETEGRDRDLFELPGDQPELIRRVAAVNPRTIVVVNAGAPHEMGWLDAPAATLSVGFAGQELGEALVDVLLGEADPGGRMPTAVPARYEQFAAWVNYPGENGVVRYGEGVFSGHRWHDAVGIPPAVPFGFGLSFTEFEFGAPRAPATAGAGEDVVVEIDVTNTGARRGTEVVQVYVEPVEPRLARPVRELKGFAKVDLEPGERTTVRIPLEARAFAYYDVADPAHESLTKGLPVPAEGGHSRRSEAGWYVDPGSYRVAVGRSSVELSHTVGIELTGDSARLPI